MRQYKRWYENYRSDVFKNRWGLALGQSDCSIFTLAISQERIDELAWIFAWWYKFRNSKSWVNNSLVDIVKNAFFKKVCFIYRDNILKWINDSTMLLDNYADMI